MNGYNRTMQNDIYLYSLSELEDLVLSFGLPKFRAKQLHEWLHTHNVASYDEMTNLPKALRAQLEQLFPLSETEVVEKLVSEDGSRKYLLKLADGAFVETVGIPSGNAYDDASSYSNRTDHPDFNSLSNEIVELDDAQEDSSPERLTVCFSTQVGCPMGCVFCATGQEDFLRNLTAQEMVDQVSAVRRDMNLRISNLVAMGQGEPFLNYDELLTALRRFNNDEAFRIGARHITVSTCGIIKGINQFAKEPEQFTLAVSLHSAIQEKRDLLMPAMVNQRLPELKRAIQNYIDKKNRRVTFEYMMIDGVNDGKEDMSALIDFCSGLLCHVNLITLNEVDSEIYMAPSPAHRMNEWVSQLESKHISATIRKSKGTDIAGACGQLKNTALISL